MPGGSGQARQDAVIVRRAIQGRWPVDPAKRGPLIERQIRIALDENTPPMVAVLAFRAILAADGQNLEQEKINRRDESAHHGECNTAVKVVAGFDPSTDV
jgi:hypothetical protein